MSVLVLAFMFLKARNCNILEKAFCLILFIRRGMISDIFYRPSACRWLKDLR